MPIVDNQARPLTLRLLDERIGPEPIDLADLGVSAARMLDMRRKLVKIAAEGRLFHRDAWDMAHHNRIFPARVKSAYLLDSIDIEICGLKVLIVTGLRPARSTLRPACDSTAALGRNTSILVGASTPLAWVEREASEVGPSSTESRRLLRDRVRRSIMRAFFP